MYFVSCIIIETYFCLFVNEAEWRWELGRIKISGGGRYVGGSRPLKFQVGFSLLVGIKKKLVIFYIVWKYFRCWFQRFFSILLPGPWDGIKLVTSLWLPEINFSNPGPCYTWPENVFNAKVIFWSVFSKVVFQKFQML